MWELYEKSTEKLELNRVLELLADCAGSEDGKAACRALCPSSDLEEVRELLEQTTAACTMSAVQGSPGFYDVKNVDAALERADRGGSLSTTELLRIAGVLRSARTVKGYWSEEETAQVLTPLFQALGLLRRQPRGGERDGVHYHFITPAQFEGMIAGQALLEYNHYASGDYYGTPAEPVRRVLDRGGTVLLDVEPNGAFQVLEKLPQAVMVFLAPPSLAELRRRLESRGDTPPDKVEARLKQAHWELAQAPHYTYLVVNDQVDVCVAQVEAILQGGPEAAACRYENQSEVEILKEVLSHAVSPHV